MPRPDVHSPLFGSLENHGGACVTPTRKVPRFFVASSVPSARAAIGRPSSAEPARPANVDRTSCDGHDLSPRFDFPDKFGCTVCRKRLGNRRAATHVVGELVAHRCEVVAERGGDVAVVAVASGPAPAMRAMMGRPVELQPAAQAVPGALAAGDGRRPRRRSRGRRARSGCWRGRRRHRWWRSAPRCAGRSSARNRSSRRSQTCSKAKISSAVRSE